MLETNYTDTDIGAAQMLDRAAEFPKSAVDDAVLAAGDRLARAIGLNPISPYRKAMESITDAMVSGEKIPQVDENNVPWVGVIGEVQDSLTFDPCERVLSRRQVVGYNRMTLKNDLFLYWTDNVYLYHTRDVNDVIASVVIWDKNVERAKLQQSPIRGACPFSEDVHEALVTGALSILGRGTFNDAQVEFWAKQFSQSLTEISGGAV